jgi:hypothetical protein
LAQRIRRPVADKIQQREEFVHLARWLIPRWLHALLLAALMPAPFTAVVSATETLRVGKAIPEAFSFVPLDIGIRKGFSPSTASRSIRPRSPAVPDAAKLYTEALLPK